MSHAGPSMDLFTWKGDLPLGPHGTVVELQINDAYKGELPEVSANDPLPEVGSFVSVWIGDIETTMYRYILVPRGLRALYADKRMLSVFCVYFETLGNRYLFRLKADQLSTKEGALWLKALVGELDPAYLAGDVERLYASPLYQEIARFLAGDRPLQAETELVLAEAAAELDGAIEFLHAPEQPRPGPYRLRLPAGPGTPVSLALRFEEIQRKVRIDGVEVLRGPGRKRLPVVLRRIVDSETVEVKARTDKEGWAQFPDLQVESPREWRFQVGGPRKSVRLEGALVLRWGRPEESNLDSPVPNLPGRDTRSAEIQSWRRVLGGDLCASWDPDRGHFRCITPGQSLPYTLAGLDAVERLGVDEPWASDFLEEGRRRTSRRKAPFPALLRYAFEGLGAATTRKDVKGQVEALEKEAPNVWTQEWAQLVQDLARALRRRPDKGLTKLAKRALEGLAYRIEAEPEPTWRYRGHGRPVKTFKANPDVAHPHAEAILAMVMAEEVLEGVDWVLEVAEAQGMHLIDQHPLDGQPPGWVLGSWKERARLETPARLGMALDVLSRRVESSKLEGRAQRVRSLVWNRFLGYYDTVEIAERFLLLDWLVTCPP